MVREAQFSCRFPAHALEISERIGDTARSRGLITWTTQRGPEYEVRFEGPFDRLVAFARDLGFANPEIVIAD